MKKKILAGAAAIVGLLGLQSLPASAAEQQSFIDSRVWNTPFDDIAQVACHNCYESQHAQSLVSALDSVRTLEIDFYDDRDLWWGDEPRSWFVRHYPTGGNNSNCSGIGNLENCLSDVKQWSDNHPGHFPVTIILDKKQGWSGSGDQRTPTDLDNLVSRVLGSKLFTPYDLKVFTGQGGSLRDAVAQRGWPAASALQGKIILVLNGHRNQTLKDYANERRLSGKIFISPETNDQGDITGKVGGMDDSSSAYVVMNNMSSGEKNWSDNVKAKNHIGRVWGNDGESFYNQLSRDTHLSAYYDYHDQTSAAGYRIRPFD
ncbi:Ca2+-dependent phosphoinositide-specific phospholipase C [Endozoicomonadaceae bacterium StTr2]